MVQPATAGPRQPSLNQDHKPIQLKDDLATTFIADRPLGGLSRHHLLPGQHIQEV